MPDAQPQISVVMPVYNALPYLDAAIESILSQTYREFEFVILDDASSDGSTQRLREWAAKDRRIRLMEAEKNLGPARSSNAVARAAKSSIVARMDADDLSYPERLAEQLQVLINHPEVGVVGGLFDTIDGDGHKIRDAELWKLDVPSVFPPFGNGTLMYRRDIFDRVGGYREECKWWEDLDLIIRMADHTRVKVVPHAIYQVRLLQTSTRLVSSQERVEHQMDLLFRAGARLEQGRSYDDIVKTQHISTKLDLRVFLSLGSVVLLAGGRPRLFSRVVKRGALTWNLQSLKALLWTAWASLHPPSLRLLLQLLAMNRNFQFHARRRLEANAPVEWSPRPRSTPVKTTLTSDPNASGA